MKAFIFLPAISISNHTGDFETIHLGHLQVEKDDVKGVFFEHLEGYPSVFGKEGIVTELSQQILDEASIYGVVLSNKNF